MCLHHWLRRSLYPGLIVLLLFIVGKTNCNGQFSQYQEYTLGTLGISAGAVFPLQDFGSESGPGAGGAQPGFFLAGEYGAPIAESDRWDWLYGVAGHFLPADLPQGFDEIGLGGETGWWTLGSMTTGIRMSGSIGTVLKLYGQLRGGGTYISSPKIETTNEGIPAWQSPSSSLTWMASAGLGVVLQERLEVHIRYLYSQPTFQMRVTGLEIAEINGERTGTVEHFDITQRISVLQLGLGWNFDLSGLRGE